MAIGVHIDFGAGATLEQYDQVIQKMGYRPGGPGGSGCLFHWVTKTPTSIHVTDVWETKEQFDKFAEEKIGPVTQEAVSYTHLDVYKRQAPATLARMTGETLQPVARGVYLVATAPILSLIHI